MRVVGLKRELKKRGLDCFGLKAELVQRLKEARAACAQNLRGADGSEAPSHEVPAHPVAAEEDSKKRKLDNAASSEASQDCNTMEWLCSKCSKSFTTKFNIPRHEKTLVACSRCTCVLANMEKAARQSTPPITNLTTTTTLKSVASVAGENGSIIVFSP